MAAAAAATEPTPAGWPVVAGVYGGGAAAWTGGSAGAGLPEKEGLAPRLGLGAMTGFGGMLDGAWLPGFAGKGEAGLWAAEKLPVDVRLERDGGGSGDRKLLDVDRGGAGLAARRSAMTLAAIKNQGSRKFKISGASVCVVRLSLTRWRRTFGDSKLLYPRMCVGQSFEINAFDIRLVEIKAAL